MIVWVLTFHLLVCQSRCTLQLIIWHLCICLQATRRHHQRLKKSRGTETCEILQTARPKWRGESTASGSFSMREKHGREMEEHALGHAWVWLCTPVCVHVCLCMCVFGLYIIVDGLHALACLLFSFACAMISSVLIWISCACACVWGIEGVVLVRVGGGKGEWGEPFKGEAFILSACQQLMIELRYFCHERE